MADHERVVAERAAAGEVSNNSLESMESMESKENIEERVRRMLEVSRECRAWARDIEPKPDSI